MDELKDRMIENWTHQRSIPKTGFVFNAIHCNFVEFLNCETGKKISVGTGRRGGVPYTNQDPGSFSICTHPSKRRGLRDALILTIRERIMNDMNVCNTLLDAMDVQGELDSPDEITKDDITFALNETPAEQGARIQARDSEDSAGD